MPDANDAVDSGLDAQLDINAILTGGTPDTSDTTKGTDASAGGQGSDGSPFKFGGRSYKTQQEAEQFQNKLYGKYSEGQALLNKLKEALTNPELFKRFSEDPEFAPILAKLGIQQAKEDLDKEVEEDTRSSGNMTMEQLQNEIRFDRQAFKLDREEAAFERTLKRELTDEEHNQVVTLIAKVPDLSFAQAWKLAMHDKLLKEATEKSTASRLQGNRPRPTPPGIPGTNLDLKKAVTEMNSAEWREAVRQSPEFQNLMK